jgi:hypothetical protein
LGVAHIHCFHQTIDVRHGDITFIIGRRVAWIVAQPELAAIG